MSIISISFSKTNSKFYKKAISLSKLFPKFDNSKGVISCHIYDLIDYLNLQYTVFELTDIIKKWHNATIYLNDKKFEHQIDFHNFIIDLRKKFPLYDIMISDFNLSKVANNSITYEQLPLPIVYYPKLYGAFFAFSKNIGEQIYFCECQRNAIYKAIELSKKINTYFHSAYNNSRSFPLSSLYFPELISQQSKTSIDKPLENFKFRPGLCFRCNHKLPMLKYCHPMYGGMFKQHYGWYINQESIVLGIDSLILDINHGDEQIKEKADNKIKEILSLLKKEVDDNDNNVNEKDIINYKAILENLVRKQFGYAKIGESWLSETLLFHIIEKIYPNEKIIRHYRPNWTEKLELDIYLPNKKLAFEYQGIQHFQAIEHWGGKQQLEKQQEHDKRKKDLCKKANVILICVDYDEELSIDYIRTKIKMIIN